MSHLNNVFELATMEPIIRTDGKYLSADSIFQIFIFICFPIILLDIKKLLSQKRFGLSSI